jgi:phosphoribosylaminoimidazole-succinocarboxamide synthase
MHMLTKDKIREQLKYVLEKTDFSGFERYEGKVRDSYCKGERRILITTDRLSCFDVCVTTVPFKGQVLQALTVKSFKETADIIPNYIVDVPHPNVIVGHECRIIPFEVVVRGYLAGSAWRTYQKGGEISGVRLPPGLNEFDKLSSPILTPSTKAPSGEHDEAISEQDILKSGKIDGKTWQAVREAAFALYQRGNQMAGERGLILADTKYEFGLFQGKLLLADEIHTLDSSRYWFKERKNDAPPLMLDKEPTRQWLLTQGFSGNGKIPEFTDDHRVSIAEHYISSYERITGETFSAVAGNMTASINSSLARYRAL